METIQVVVSVVAVLISIASFVIAQRSAARTKKAEAIQHLLGEKETVAFAGLKLIRDGLPVNDKERALVLAALMQASVFEGSDRARAVIYRVIELNRAEFRTEFKEALKSINETFNSMSRYGFKPDELDLSRGQRRISAVEISSPRHENA
jgi:hypothetical protein